MTTGRPTRSTPRRHPRPTRRLSAEELEKRTGWEGKEELVRGRIVREPPVGFEHGREAADLGSHLREFLRRRGLPGHILCEVGFILSERPDTVRGPDIAYIATDPRDPASGWRQRGGYLVGAPDLAVEIVSPSDTLNRLREKADEYLGAGSALVWIVHPEGRWIEVHQPGRGAVLLREDAMLDAGAVLPGFQVQVGELFGG